MKRRLSIRWVLTVSMVAVTLAAMIVVSSVYSATATDMFNQLGMSSMLQSIQQVSERLSDVCRRVNTMLAESGAAVEQVENLDPQEFPYYIGNTVRSTTEITALVLLDEYGKPVASYPEYRFKQNSAMMEQDWFDSALQAGIGETVYSRPHVQNLFDGQYPWVVSVTRKVRCKQAGEEHIYILMADMSLTPLREICTSVTLGSAGHPFVMTEEDEIVYHTDQKLLALELVTPGTILMEEEQDKGKSMVISQEIEGTNWSVVGTVLAEDIEESSRSFKSRMMGIVLFIALCVLVASVMLSRQLVGPLQSIRSSMQRIEQELDESGTEHPLPEQGFAEYAALSHSYNTMLGRVRELMNETVEHQRELRQMEIGALQEQINPHFLYNTLDSIVRVMETGRVPQAIEMVQALAKLFRLSINNGQYLLTVEQEMDYARNYLTIQQVRYRKAFRYELQMDERIRDMLCPKIILQPLIENAIKHGISGMPGCTLRVCARQEGYNIVFTVEDDGLGIPPERLEELKKMLRDDRNTLMEKSEFGIGLRNTNRRIRLLYGDDYGLDIESEVEERTCITITLPKQPR